MYRFNKMVVVTMALSAATMGGYTGRLKAAEAAASTNAAPPSKIIAPAQVDLPTVPTEVLRMSEAGVNDQLIISYIEKSDNPYILDASQIVYLHDMGISSAVLKALVDHSGTASNEAAATSQAPAEQNALSNQTAATTTQANPPVTGTAANFYGSLAPYGSWIYVPVYGWCWQPAAVIVNPAWQPYCNNGCWLWTNQGWYWNSYYSWGWAPFHYGRWCQYPGYGWLWCPGNAWGPAWVCWRNSPDYCGWAPLPPGAYFTAGVGWTYNGIAVGFNYGFGLGPGCFTFCDYDDFCHPHPYHYFKHGHDADHYYHHSQVNNDYAMGRHHEVINRGIPPSRIEGATHTRIRQVAIREMPHQAGRSGNFTMPDRLTQSGHSRVIYRPGKNVSAVRNSFLPGRYTPLASHRENGNTAFTRGSTAGRSVGNSFRFPNGPQHRTPGVQLNRSHNRVFNRRMGTVGNSYGTRSSPQPVGRPGYSYSRHSAPVFRSAPAWRPAPSRHSAPSVSWRSAPSRPAPRSFSRPAPSFGGNRSGGAAHFGGGAHSGGGGRHFGGGGGMGHGARR